MYLYCCGSCIVACWLVLLVLINTRIWYWNGIKTLIAIYWYSFLETMCRLELNTQKKG